MGITFEVRRADLNDLSQLAMLFDKYRQFYKQTPNLEGARAFIEDRIKANESAIFIVMDSSGRSVGFTQLFPMFSSVRMRSIWVYFLVRPDPLAASARAAGLSQHAHEASISLLSLFACSHVALQNWATC